MTNDVKKNKDLTELELKVATDRSAEDFYHMVAEHRANPESSLIAKQAVINGRLYSVALNREMEYLQLRVPKGGRAATNHLKSRIEEFRVLNKEREEIGF